MLKSYATMTTRLHGICNGCKNRMEDWGGGGGTGDKSPHTTHLKFQSFVWDWEGPQKCFILSDQTTGDLKSHHLQAQVHTHSPVCTHTAIFSFRRIVGNPLSQLCITV